LTRLTRIVIGAVVAAGRSASTTPLRRATEKRSIRIGWVLSESSAQARIDRKTANRVPTPLNIRAVRGTDRALLSSWKCAPVAADASAVGGESSVFLRRERSLRLEDGQIRFQLAPAIRRGQHDGDRR